MGPEHRVVVAVFKLRRIEISCRFVFYRSVQLIRKFANCMIGWEQIAIQDLPSQSYDCIAFPGRLYGWKMGELSVLQFTTFDADSHECPRNLLFLVWLRFIYFGAERLSIWKYFPNVDSAMN